LQQLGDERGPAGLMAGTDARAGVSVEVFVKGNQVVPVPIVLEVIDAQRTRLQTERARLQTLNQQMTTSVLLIKALGGGWTGAVPSAAGPPGPAEPDVHAWN